VGGLGLFPPSGWSLCNHVHTDTWVGRLHYQYMYANWGGGNFMNNAWCSFAKHKGIQTQGYPFPQAALLQPKTSSFVERTL
jgi:hypothetical protein